MRRLAFLPVLLLWAYFTAEDALPPGLRLALPQGSPHLAGMCLFVSVTAWSLWLLPRPREWFQSRRSAVKIVTIQLLGPWWLYGLLYAFLPDALQLLPNSGAALVLFPTSAVAAGYLAYRAGLAWNRHVGVASDA